MNPPYNQRDSDSWYNTPYELKDSNWGSGGGSYPPLGQVPNKEDFYHPQWKYTSISDSPLSSYSAHSSRSLLSSSPRDGNMNFMASYPQQSTYLFDMSTAMSIQSTPFTDFELEEMLCSQSSASMMAYTPLPACRFPSDHGSIHQTPSFSLPKPSPFPFVCPASNPRRLCSCTNMSHNAFLELPYNQHLGSKPLRAMPDPCRKSLLERFPLGFRDTVIEILAEPLSRTHLLMELVVRYDKDTPGNRFGCICCLNARFQSVAKVDRHLRGLFDIRTVPCQYCAKTSIHRDDNNNHEKICPGKKKRTSANTLSHPN